MNKIKIFFTEDMLKENKSFSPSSYKPKLVLEDWLKNYNSRIEVSNFLPIHKLFFNLAHAPKYVDGIFDGSLKNGFGFNDKEFATTFNYTTGSLYAAAIYALENKIAVSPTSGFHHAGYSKSEGFCTFNGLVITAMMLKENKLVNKVGILDFDMHYGNGTEEIIKKHNLSYITHYTAGRYYDLHYPLLDFAKPLIKYFYNKLFTPKQGIATPKPKFRQKILKGKGRKFLSEIPSILEKFKSCGLIIYQAGADQHVNDPYGGLLTYDELLERDKLVFDFCKTNNIAVVWNLAGGYQRDNNGTIEPILLCHRNTMKACLDVFD
jgi:acetoin utilization deacetylase AcuC-like enzyme